jgi:hypothetical protein
LVQHDIRLGGQVSGHDPSILNPRAKSGRGQQQ